MTAEERAKEFIDQYFLPLGLKKAIAELIEQAEQRGYQTHCDEVADNFNLKD